MKDVASSIDAVLERARANLARLAEEYRRTVLIPLCSKHRLTYLAGMGRTLFSTEDGVDIGNAGDARDERLRFSCRCSLCSTSRVSAPTMTSDST